MNRLRVGAVSYLNTKPLVFGLERYTEQMELTYDLPSRLADRLATGEIDVGLIPSVEYFQSDGYRIVSNACIACRGPVWSVKLLSRVPMSQVRTLALDEGSRTSVALAKILLKRRCRLDPETCLLPIGADASSCDTDAVLLIGDRAMHSDAGTYQDVWDLGEEWCRWSGLPFVFAMWVAPADLELGELPAILEHCRDLGLRNLSDIAACEAPRAGLTAEAGLSYLRDHLHFILGPQEQSGLDRFRKELRELELIPGGREATAARLGAGRSSPRAAQSRS